MKPTLCIFHKGCQDGFASAWVVRKYYAEAGRLDDVEFHPGVYGEVPPDPTDREVIMVDFSYSRELIGMMAAVANKVTVIDHHKTAVENLAGLDTERENIRLIFDMERSGAGLTWDVFFPRQTRPDLIDVIEDRDLWRFALDNTREITATIFSHPYDFGVWDELMEQADTYQGFMDLVRQGATLMRKQAQDLDELLPLLTRSMTILGHVVPVANLPKMLVSEAGNRLCAGGDGFAMCYSDTAQYREFSLRSDKTRPNAIDVSAIAKQLGGGGHKNAAGFRVPRDHVLAKL